MPEVQNIEREVLFKSTDAKKQIVVGVVLEPDSVDIDEDVVSIEEIEKAAHGFLADSRVLSNNHRKDAKGKLITADATVVESFIAPVDYVEGGQEIKKGSWVIAVKVHSEKMWHDIEKGEYTGFSIGGSGYRTVID